VCCCEDYEFSKSFASLPDRFRIDSSTLTDEKLCEKIFAANAIATFVPDMGHNSLFFTKEVEGNASQG
jgi:hypothetical protein